MTPDVTGMPLWPGGTQTLPQLPLPDNKALRLAGEISDPRWSGAPLRPLAANSSGTSDNGRYRVIVDRTTNPTQLAVQIVMRSKQGAPTANDFAYFGISDDPNQTTPGTPLTPDRFKAWGIRVLLEAPAAGVKYQPVVAGKFASYTWDSGSWSANTTTLPSWIVPNSLAVWYFDGLSTAGQSDIALNGAQLAVAFKVNLAAPSPLNILVNRRARIMLGTEVGIASGTAGYSEPATESCTGCTFPAPINGAPAIPFFADMNNWKPVSPIGNATSCAGISIESHDITATNTAASDARCNGRSNCLSAHAGETNSFRATPTVPEAWTSEGTILGQGDVTTTFKLSNWGSVAQPTEWRPLATVGNQSEDAMGNPYADANDLEAHPMSHVCAPNAADGNVCTLPNVTTNYNDNRFHQCLLAELNPGPNASSKVTFANTAAYINTRFEHASLIDNMAEINVRGVPNLDPANANRYVYLHVVRTNMVPAGGSTTRVDVPFLEATRSQLDRDFSDKRNACSHPTDQCIPLDGPSTSGCVSPCDGANNNQCAPSRTAYQFGGGQCWCIPTNTSTIEWCTYRPATNATVVNVGAYNPDKRARDGSQTLNGTYPTVEVFPYYDSGRNVTINGRTTRRLVPMATFGIHAWHDGDFYGWLTDIVDETGGMVEKYAPDVYRISVPKSTGIKRIRLLVSAEESAHYAPFTAIVGTATPLALGLGNVTLTGVSNTAFPIDLSRTQMTINNLLKEGAVERVTNLNGPVTLTRQPGATASAAVFRSSGAGRPTIIATVANLPVLGQTVQITVTSANVQAPASCPLFFGTSMLTTEFRLSDGVNPAVTLRGTDQWTCVPFQLLNL